MSRVYQIGSEIFQVVRVLPGLDGAPGVSGLLQIGAATIPASGSVPLSVTPAMPANTPVQIQVLTTNGKAEGTLLNGVFTRQFPGTALTVPAGSTGFVIGDRVPATRFLELTDIPLVSTGFGDLVVARDTVGLVFVDCNGGRTNLSRTLVYNATTQQGLPPLWSSGSTWVPNFNIWYDGTDMPTDNHIGGVLWYVNPTTGNDANTGLSPAQALRTVSRAITLIDAQAPGTNLNNTVFVSAGILFGTQWRTSNGRTPLNRNFALIGTGPTPNSVVLTSSPDPATISWTNNGDGTFSTTLATAPEGCIDMGSIDSDGQFTRLNVATSLANLLSLSQGAWISGNTIRIKPIRAGAPDNQVLVPTVGPGARFENFFSTNSYWSNLCFAGVGLNLQMVSLTANSVHRLVNVRIVGYRQSTFDGLSCTNTSATFTMHVLMKNCRISYCTGDSFNYNNNLLFALEDGCLSNESGFFNVGSNQGSTGHNGSDIIRVAGTYKNSGGQNIASVNAGSQDWIINCLLQNPRAGNNIDCQYAAVDTCRLQPETYAGAPDVYYVRRTGFPAGQSNIFTY